jgi:hypothetical protein
MTRNLIRFATMDTLLKLPASTDLQQVPVGQLPALSVGANLMRSFLSQLLAELSRSQELGKPVRRLEKSVLNDFMRSVRFPLKQRVQEPWLKTYVLLQAAVGRVEVKDFALKVEQAEIVECGLRVLAAVRDLAVHRELGRLLESTILLDRALRQRLWESNYGSVYLQCPGLLSATLNSLVLRGVRTIGDALGYSLVKVQDMAGCTQPEARSVLALAKLLHEGSRVVRATLSQSTLRIEVSSASTSSTSAAADSLAAHDRTTPTYHLVVYDAQTGTALCIRNIPHDAQRAEYTVRCPSDLPLSRVQCSLLSDYVGVDSYQNAACTTASGVAAASLVSAPQQSASNNATKTVGKAATKVGNSVRPGAKSVVDNTTYQTASTGARNPLTAYYPVQPSPSKPQQSLNAASTDQGPRAPQYAAASAAEDVGPQQGNPFQARTLASSAAPPANSSGMDAYAYQDDVLPDCGPPSWAPPRRSAVPSPVATEEKGEIAAIRRKAVELQLDRIPVKRLRNATASAPLPGTLPAAPAHSDADGITNAQSVHAVQNAAVVSPISPGPRSFTVRVTRPPSPPNAKLLPEQWYQRVAPHRRSFLDDSDDPVIPAAFDFAFDTPPEYMHQPSHAYGGKIQPWNAKPAAERAVAPPLTCVAAPTCGSGMFESNPGWDNGNPVQVPPIPLHSAAPAYPAALDRATGLGGGTGGVKSAGSGVTLRRGVDDDFDTVFF